MVSAGSLVHLRVSERIEAVIVSTDAVDRHVDLSLQEIPLSLQLVLRQEIVVVVAVVHPSVDGGCCQRSVGHGGIGSMLGHRTQRATSSRVHGGHTVPLKLPLDPSAETGALRRRFDRPEYVDHDQVDGEDHEATDAADDDLTDGEGQRSHFKELRLMAVDHVHVVEEDVGHHGREEQRQAAGGPLDSREATLVGAGKDGEPQVAVAEILSTLAVEQEAEGREFTLASHGADSLNLSKDGKQKADDNDTYLGNIL